MESRYERVLAGHGGAAPVLAEASRRARVEATERGMPEPLAAVAAGVAAPLLVGFALWVADQAEQQGLRRLHFVARDGEVMLAVAAPVLARLAPGVRCRYLYGSRQAWTLAGSAWAPEVLRDWVSVQRDITPRSALRRVGLTPDQVWALTGAPFSDPAVADRPLDAAGRDALSRSVADDPLLSLVRRAAGEAAERTLAYLRQEGFAGDASSALVDVGWTGRTARAFDHLVRALDGRPVRHLFCGVVAAARAVRREPEPPQMTGWLFDDDLGRPASCPLTGPNVLVEMLCAGREGRLLRYERGPGGDVVPVLAEPVNQPVLDWGLDDVRRVVARVTDLVAPQLTEEHLRVDLAGPVTEALSAFWTRPTRAEALAWGTFPWEEETWPPYYPVAHRVSLGDVAARLRRGDRRIRRHNSWRAGSAVVSPQPWRGLLTAKAAYERRSARAR